MSERFNETGFVGSYLSILNGKVLGNSPWKYKSPYFIGTQKILDPLASGSFIPGVIRVNPVYISQAVASCTVGSVSTVARNGWVYQLTGNWGMTTVTSPYSDGYDVMMGNETFIKAAAKIADTDFDALLFLAELREAIELIRHPLKEINKLITNYRNSLDRVDKLKSSIDGFANLWLTFIYGVKPIMSDIENAMKAYSTGLRKQASYVVKRANVDSTDTLTKSESLVTNYSFLPIAQTIHSFKVTYHANVYYQCLLQADLSWMASRLGFSIKNIPAVVWERVPLSFVVDWVFRVSDWLKAITPDPHFNYLNSGISMKTVIKQITEVTSVTHETREIDMSTFVPTRYTYNQESLRRVIPTRTVYFPPVKSAALSLTKQISSLALIWQRLPSSLRKLKR